MMKETVRKVNNNNKKKIKKKKNNKNIYIYIAKENARNPAWTAAYNGLGT